MIKEIKTGWWKGVGTIFADTGDGFGERRHRTRIYSVHTTNKKLLGYIRWVRKNAYSFMAVPDREFTPTQLREIAQFAETLTKEHKEQLPGRRERLKLQRERNLAKIAKKRLTNQADSATL